MTVEYDNGECGNKNCVSAITVGAKFIHSQW